VDLLRSKSLTPGGRCDSCRLARRITSARGATFILCERAATDPAYARYPRLPRLTCAGHEPAEAPAGQAARTTRKP
jgi:hypothetical protein